MFGIIMGLLSLGSYGVAAAQKNKENHEAWKRGQQRYLRGENPSETYYDYRGTERSLRTGAIQTTTRRNGDRVLTNAYGEIIRNFDEERRQAHYDQEIKTLPEGKTVIDWPVSNEYGRHARGFTYKDIITGKIVVERSVYGMGPGTSFLSKEVCQPIDDIKRSSDFHDRKGIRFYMDWSTGDLIRVADCHRCFICDDSPYGLTRDWERKCVYEYNDLQKVYRNKWGCPDF